VNVSRETMEKIDFKIIAIDGPSGVGKSTISGQIADRLGFYYVDTGAMFRCLAWNWGRHGSPENEDSFLKLGNQTEILLTQKGVFCNGTDVTHIIREEKISKNASKISVFKSIREVMKKKQRELVQNIRDSKEYQGAVLEGRDIGSVVFPKAEFKFFLDATPEVRAKRRMLQIHAKGGVASFKEILESLNKRDYRDKNRKVAPLKPAADAIIVDTGELNERQVLFNLLSYVKGCESS